MLGKNKVLVVCLAAVVVVYAGFLHPLKVYSDSTAVEKGVVYLKSQAQTAWSTMALAANGESNVDLGHLLSVASGQKSATTYAKNILALVSVSQNPTSFGSEDYIAALKGYFQNEQFGDKSLINDDVWAILALGSVGQENFSQTQAAKDYILSSQNQDGGWGYATSAESDTNSAASAIMALLEAGVGTNSIEITNAFAYLKAAQNQDGGFSYSSGGASDSCSSAWVISAIYKAGYDPTDSSWMKGGQSPVDSLLTFQDDDGGFWWQSEGDNKFCTPYAVLALSGKSYPVDTVFNTHKIRIEGESEILCNTELSGGTVMDLVIAAADVCGYSYSIIEYPGIGLYLSELAGEESWMYMVNNASPMIGADSYYLNLNDTALLYSGDWLDDGWFSTKVELTKTTEQAVIQAKYYNAQSTEWENLLMEVKIQIGDVEMTTDTSGNLTIALAGFADGLYPVFVKRQVVSGFGYIRSERENLSIGSTPSEHQVGLKVEVEQVQAPAGGMQESISFSLSPSLLDFGKLKAGESAVRDLTFGNGDSAVYLQSEATGDDVFRGNLEIDNTSWRSFSDMVESNQQKVFEIGLSIPLNFDGSVGIKEGELTFWAIKL